MKKLLPVLCCAALGIASPAFAAITAFSYTSSPASITGAGDSRTIFEGEAGLAFTVVANEEYFSLQVTTAVPPPGMVYDPEQFWSASLAPASGSILGTGHYTEAMMLMYREAGRPGIFIATHHGATNMPGGEFTVLEIEKNSGGSVVSFAADFIQYDNEDPEKWNKGSVRFNSSVPLTIPEPQPAVLALLALGVCHRRRRRHRSFQSAVFSFQRSGT